VASGHRLGYFVGSIAWTATQPMRIKAGTRTTTSAPKRKCFHGGRLARAHIDFISTDQAEEVAEVIRGSARSYEVAGEAIHTWIGLIAGLLTSVISVTHSIIVCRHPRWLCGQQDL
jgi:hypothetical protein